MDDKEKIFVSIAAYLDLDARNTVLDCFQKAKYPERLVFGICWQFEESIGVKADFLSDLNAQCQMRILKYHYLESEGPSWAKNKARQLYQREEFCLMIDAHMRFVKDWDTLLVLQHRELKNSGLNPIISYLPPTFHEDDFEYHNQLDFIHVPNVIAVSEDNLFEYLENNEKHTHFKSIASPIIEPSFIFAEGAWLDKVLLPHEIYYIAEEVYLSIYSFMMGYDIFLQQQIVAWHRSYYPSRIKHYTTHPFSDSKEKLRLSLKSLNELLLGNKEELKKNSSLRSLKDYERYANVKFHLSEK